MRQKISAVILCGGKGTRLKKLGRKMPKTLVRIGGRPFIKYIISSLNNQSINKIIVSGYYKFNLIKKKLDNMKLSNLEIINDGNVRILERIKKNLIKEKKPILVCYGDEYANINLNQLLKSHYNSRKILTITTCNYKSNYGFLKLNDNKYTFIEKPLLGRYNIGYMIFDYKNINLIKNAKSLPNYINKLCALKQVNEYIHKKNHITFNTIEDVSIAQNKINKINNDKF